VGEIAVTGTNGIRRAAGADDQYGLHAGSWR
jgi:hypothetical protein